MSHIPARAVIKGTRQLAGVIQELLRGNFDVFLLSQVEHCAQFRRQQGYLGFFQYPS